MGRQFLSRQTGNVDCGEGTGKKARISSSNQLGQFRVSLLGLLGSVLGLKWVMETLIATQNPIDVSELTYIKQPWRGGHS